MFVQEPLTPLSVARTHGIKVHVEWNAQSVSPTWNFFLCDEDDSDGDGDGGEWSGCAAIAHLNICFLPAPSLSCALVSCLHLFLSPAWGDDDGGFKGLLD